MKLATLAHLPLVCSLLLVPARAEERDAQDATENVFHFCKLGVGDCGRWRPVGRSTMQAGRWSAWAPGNTVNLHVQASKAGQGIHGMRLDGLGLPLPEAVRFRAWGDTNYLFVVVGDARGRRLISRTPFEAMQIRNWCTIEVRLADMLTVGVGAEAPEHLDMIGILTRESAGEFRQGGAFLFAFKDFEAVYPAGEGPVDPPEPTREDIEAVLAPLTEALPAIDALFDEAKSQGVDTRYPRVSRTVIERYRSELFQMLEEGRRFFALTSASYLVRCAERIEAELEAVIANPDLAIDYPDVSLGHLRCREGSFFSGDRPVMLAGLCGWFNPSHFEELSNMGYSCISTEIGPRHTVTGDGGASYEGLDGIQAVLAAAAAQNMAVDLLLSPHYFPGWARERWPGTDATGLRQRLNNFMPWTVTDPHFRDVIARHVAITVPYLRDHPALLSYDLINEAWYRAIPDYPESRWTDFRQAHPETDELQALSDVSTANVTEFLRWNMAELSKHDTVHPVHIKAISTEDSLSVDREAVGDILTANGMDAMQSWPDLSLRLAADFGWPFLRHDFHRSLQPDNPIMDAEYHMTAGAEDGANMPDNYAYAAIWGTALHGRDMGCNWVFHRVDTASVYWHINAVEALGRTALDLVRLGPEVHAFQRQTGPLALYYGGVNTADAYYACLFQDRDVGVVTDTRIRDGQLERYRVLVVPWPKEWPRDVQENVDAFETAGGAVVKLPHTSDLDALWRLVREPMAAQCPEPLVRVGTWGVECRSLKHGGRGLCYLLNHRRDSVTVKPHTAWHLADARDLRTDRPLDASTLELAPLELRLFEVAIP